MTNSEIQLIGPFSQLLSLANMPLRGAIRNEEIEIQTDAGILSRDGEIIKADNYKVLFQEAKENNYLHTPIEDKVIALPGFIDSHTHLVFSGQRYKDYALRNGGSSYLEIAGKGGGIWDTVTKTREASYDELFHSAYNRLNRSLKKGITTIEIKSGYGLDVANELKMLRIINELDKKSKADVIATCLAAHLKPKDFEGSNQEYLDLVLRDLIPAIKKESLCQRADIFVEKSAFGVEESRIYLEKLKDLGFQITIHGDQFSVGGSKLGIAVGALSVDHLEASGDKEVKLFSDSNTVATVLPGASIGLGEKFSPARKLLDSGAILAIASDWNPGSAPMGDLITQAAILGTYEKLTDAEIFAGITYRAAKALALEDRGRLKEGFLADVTCYQVNDYREILYNQGQLTPCCVYKNGQIVNNKI